MFCGEGKKEERKVEGLGFVGRWERLGNFGRVGKKKKKKLLEVRMD